MLQLLYPLWQQAKLISTVGVRASEQMSKFQMTSHSAPPLQVQSLLSKNDPMVKYSHSNDF